MRSPEFLSSSHKKDPFSRRVVFGNITFYFRYQQPDIEPAKFHSPIYTCWLQEAMGQGFHSSPDPLPLSYATRHASRLSVAGTWHLIPNSMVADSLHRNPVREGITTVQLHTFKNKV